MKRKKNLIRKKARPVAVGAAMADMAMLLLVFFMTTTTTEPPRGIEVQPPAGYVQPAEQESLFITISREGNYYLDGERSSLENIADALAMRAHEKETSVSITADKNIPYSTIKSLLNVLQEGDFLNVTFMAEEKMSRGTGNE